MTDTLSPDPLPTATPAHLAAGGAYKVRDEDFRVEEIPAYTPCGTGDHLYVIMEKQGMPTAAAMRRVAAALGIDNRRVGAAGHKDAAGVTRQYLSLERVDEGAIAACSLPDIRLHVVGRHTNKLKMGHLRGNRFDIVLRDVRHPEHVEPLVDMLWAHGIPNYFGEQRFGYRNDTHLVGKHLVDGAWDAAVDTLLGGAPMADEGPAAARARRLYTDGDLDGAARAWPRSLGENARVCRALAQGAGPRRALAALGKHRLGFFVSAWQSHLFNQVLAARIRNATWNRVCDGDVAVKHANGACFSVTDADAEAPRAQAGDISPTGPLFGKKMKTPTGVPGDIEAAVLRAARQTAAAFSTCGPFGAPGGRRPLRVFFLERPRVERLDATTWRLTFALPSGSYATCVLREITKAFRL